MKTRKLILGVIAGAALSFAGAVQAATVLNLGVNILTTGNVPIPPTSPGVWDLAPGTGFRVQVTATLTNPNLSDGGHSPDGGDTFGPPGTVLGIQSLSVNLVTNGTAGLLTPAAGSTASRWGSSPNGGFDATLQMSPTTIGAPFANLIDQGGDGDLDPSGMGYAQTAISWDGSAGQLPGIQNGITNVNIMRGGYTASMDGGTNVLTFTGVNGLAFLEAPSNDNSLTTEAFAQTLITAATINVVPEPAAAGLFGLASLGLFGIRRRRASSIDHSHIESLHRARPQH